MNFKKAILVSAAVLAAAGIIAGCGDQKAASSASSKAAKETTIKVGVSPDPHAEIVGVVKEKLAKEGVKVGMVNSPIMSSRTWPLQIRASMRTSSSTNHIWMNSANPKA